MKTYSEIRFIFEPNSFFGIMFVALESKNFKTPDSRKNGKWIKMDLIHFYSGPFIWCFSVADTHLQ
jgi:hypothetical protein